MSIYIFVYIHTYIYVYWLDKVIYNNFKNIIFIYLTTPPLKLDATQGQFLSRV